MSVNNFLKAAAKRSVKSSEITEKDIEDEYVKFAKTLGCKALKLIYLNKRGFPDRTTVCPGGRVLFIEFKRKGGKQSPAQKIVQQFLTELGFEYHVCDEHGQAEQLLKTFLSDSK